MLRKRLQEAISYRQRVVRDTDAFRVLFSEADFLPGLIVDRYNDLLSLQVLTQAMDSEAVRQVIVSELTERLKPAAIAERVDPRVRELEPTCEVLQFVARRTEDHRVFHEWGSLSLRSL